MINKQTKYDKEINTVCECVKYRLLRNKSVQNYHLCSATVCVFQWKDTQWCSIYYTFSHLVHYFSPSIQNTTWPCMFNNVQNPVNTQELAHLKYYLKKRKQNPNSLAYVNKCLA